MTALSTLYKRRDELARRIRIRDGRVSVLRKQYVLVTAEIVARETALMKQEAA